MATDALRAEKCGRLFEGMRSLQRCLQHGAKLPLEGCGVVRVNPKQALGQQLCTIPITK